MLFEAYALRWYVVPGLSPVSELSKLPVPAPLLVLLSSVDGNSLVKLQQIPRSITGSPPSDVTVPFTVADEEVMLLAVEVITTGNVLGGFFLQLKIKKIIRQ